MTEFSGFIQGGANAWFFIPSAILLGALHGLEPGHSKTMMAAFIVAIRGTVVQAVLLGLAATLSHTAIVWLLALPAAYFGSQWNAEASEPYFQLVSAILILVIALWMLARSWRQQHHHHEHHHEHLPEAHAAEKHDRMIETDQGVVRIVDVEDGAGWWIRIAPASPNDASHIDPDNFKLEVRTMHGTSFDIAFEARESFCQSARAMDRSHVSSARLVYLYRNDDFGTTLSSSRHASRSVAENPSLEEVDSVNLDPHAQAHARDIRHRFANRDISTWQIFLFGLSGGLIPCSAAVAVLLMCLQLKKVVLGAVLVLSFSLGLAITLILSGVIAAVGVRQLTRHWTGFEVFARRAPYFSGILIILVGLYVGYHGLRGLLG